MKLQEQILRRRRLQSRPRRRDVGLVGALLLLVVSGCRFLEDLHSDGPEAFSDAYVQAATAIEYPDVGVLPESRALSTAEPVMLTSSVQPDYRDVTLEEAIRLGLSHSKILRDMGGAGSPDASRCRFVVRRRIGGNGSPFRY